MTTNTRLLCFVALGSVGCFNPTYDNGASPCSAHRECPDGYVCAADDHCYRPDALPDLSVQLDLSTPCPAGQHLCAGACASNTDPATCGASCTPCVALAHASTSCDGTSCQYTCDAGYKICNGACVSTTDSTDCNGTCNPGYHLCGAMCLLDSDVNNCGKHCTPCVPTAGSSGMAICVPAGSGVIDDAGLEDYICVTPNCAVDTDCVAANYCDNNGVCQPRKAQGGACDTTADCKVSGCRECAASTAGCVDGFCCNTACGGACDACSIAAGGSVNGTCALRSPGSTGSPSCSPLVCNGAIATCPPSCAGDADCIAADYCDNNGTCQTRKNQGGACDTTADCKVAGCRECGAATAGCVDNFCCNTACSGSCDACSVAGGASVNGTCGLRSGGSPGSPSCTPYLCNGSMASCPGGCTSDADCIGTDYCDNNGFCQNRKAQGGSCDTTADCKVAGCHECNAATSGCVDGFCCNTACAGSCNACSVAGGALVNGTCHVVSAGAVGSPTCAPYLCNGSLATCPGGCSTDADCASADYCDNGGTCQMRKLQGGSCNTTTDCKVAGCRECDAATAGCVDGFCCNSACNGSCNACSVAGGATTNGTCAILAPHAIGSPACAPYLCDGIAASCPGSCADDTDCAAADYCDNNGTCQMQKTTGAPCDTTADCKVAGCRECDISCTAGTCD